MSNSYRIRTKPGVDSSIKILIDHKCPRREEITVETKTTEDTLKLLYVSTVVEDVLRTKLSKDSQSEILLINHLKRILNKIELSNSTSSQSCTLKCNIVSDVPFTPESLKSDQLKTEESELHLKEFKETHLERLLELIKNDDL